MSDDVPLQKHLRMLRKADRRFHHERDRRYREVNIEREKALRIKETADETARVLAREIQDYKDEKANELRSQIERERGTYATKEEIKPLVDFMSSSSGAVRATTESRSDRRLMIGLVIAGITLIIMAISVATAIVVAVSR